eukprot:SM001356S00206  [mRNA]  locus=s1356:927:2030:- [translate_table: standard]
MSGGHDCAYNVWEDQDHVVNLKMDSYCGPGFQSRQRYLYGTFSVDMAFPPGYTAGVSLSFYMASGNGYYDKRHDEIDWELLGNLTTQSGPSGVTIQTNYFANGLGHHEQRRDCNFDPAAFNTYTIDWHHDVLRWLVNGQVIRQMKRGRGSYPIQPMRIQISEWDASPWATWGGRYKVDYDKGPYIAKLKNFKISARPYYRGQPVNRG